jgi:aminoglycoside phosphotransferase (APT) family kinase protein
MPARTTDLKGLVTWLERERRPVTGLTHNDIFEGNVLVHRGRVSTVLDWEEANIDWQVWDLASSLSPFCSDGDRLDQRAVTEFLDRLPGRWRNGAIGGR